MDLPIENGGSFHSYVAVYQRVSGEFLGQCKNFRRHSLRFKNMSASEDLFGRLNFREVPDASPEPCQGAVVPAPRFRAEAGDHSSVWLETPLEMELQLAKSTN